MRQSERIDLRAVFERIDAMPMRRRERRERVREREAWKAAGLI